MYLARLIRSMQEKRLENPFNKLPPEGKLLNAFKVFEAVGERDRLNRILAKKKKSLTSKSRNSRGNSRENSREELNNSPHGSSGKIEEDKSDEKELPVLSKKNEKEVRKLYPEELVGLLAVVSFVSYFMFGICENFLTLY
ncbi:uncharacterized protein LOC142332222 isoform X2 [Lycorma delicatula]|uniref:uncharacterized protein LOC142332222 isoform X2 n=1 Tax=Lycorma delicatula TaxID=130591 RepID=UPI003F51976C